MCLFECFTPLSSVCLLQGGGASLYSKIERLFKNVSDERIKKQADDILNKWAPKIERAQKRKAEETFGGAAEDGSGVSGEHAVKQARAADDRGD